MQLYSKSRLHRVLLSDMVSFESTVEEKYVVDCHDGDGFTDSGTDTCDDTVGKQLVECLGYGTQCHTICQMETGRENTR